MIAIIDIAGLREELNKITHRLGDALNRIEALENKPPQYVSPPVMGPYRCFHVFDQVGPMGLYCRYCGERQP